MLREYRKIDVVAVIDDGPCGPAFVLRARESLPRVEKDILPNFKSLITLDSSL